MTEFRPMRRNRQQLCREECERILGSCTSGVLALTGDGVADFYRIVYGENLLRYSNFNSEHQRCLDFIKKSVSASHAKHKVVVTHHVPSYQLVAPEFQGRRINGAFTVELADYIADSGIDYWLYGHSHRKIDKTIGTTRCLCNQFGYVSHNEQLSFDRGKIIEV